MDGLHQSLEIQSGTGLVLKARVPAKHDPWSEGFFSFLDFEIFVLEDIQHLRQHGRDTIGTICPLQLLKASPENHHGCRDTCCQNQRGNQDLENEKPPFALH